MQTGTGTRLWRKNTGTGDTGWTAIPTFDDMTGTAGNLAKWTGTNTLGNSIVTESGTVVRVVGGSLVVDTTLGVSGAATFSAPGTTNTAPNLFNAGTNVLAARFGSGDTTGFTVNQYGGAVRFNGTGTQWGDLAFFPTGGGNGNQGHFRFSVTGDPLDTTPDAKLGVGDLYVAGNGGFGTLSPTAKVHAGTGSFLAGWPYTASVGTPALGMFAHGTSASPVALTAPIVSIVGHVTGEPGANEGLFTVYASRAGGDAMAGSFTAVPLTAGRQAAAIQGHVLMDAGTVGSYAAGFPLWLSCQVYNPYDSCSTEINPGNFSGADPANDGEYQVPGLSNALALIATGNKKSSSAIYIGTQDLVNAQFQRGIDFQQGAISGNAIVLPNAAAVAYRNVANSAKVPVVKLNAGNDLELLGGLVTVLDTGEVGAGTTDPKATLHLSSNVPRVALFDTDAALSSANPAWIVRASNDGFFRIQTTSDVNYTTIENRLTLDTAGQMKLWYDASNYITFTVGATGTVTMDIVGTTAALVVQDLMRGANYVSQLTEGALNLATGEADLRYLFVDEMHAKVFIADLEQALAGGQIISKSVAMVHETFTCPAASATAALTVRDLPSATGMATFQNGDWVVLRTFSRAAGSLTIANCVGTVVLDAAFGASGFCNVGNGCTTGTAHQRYTFTRGAGPIGAGVCSGAMAASTQVLPDSLGLDYGVPGNGFVETSAIDGIYGANSPYTRTVTWTTCPISANFTVRTQVGNVKGITSVLEYGAVLGRFAATDGQYIRATNLAFELHGIDLTIWDGTNCAFKMIRNAGAPYFSMGAPCPTAYATGTGIFMGDDGGYKFRVGNPSGNQLAWNGSILSIGDVNNEWLYLNGSAVRIQDGATIWTEVAGGILTLGPTAVSGQIIISAASGLQMLDAASVQRVQLTIAGVLTLGVTSGEHLYADGTSLRFKDGATIYTDLTAGALTLGASTDTRILLDTTNGFRLVDEAGNVRSQLSTAGVLTLGDTAVENVLISSAAVQIRDGTAVLAELAGGSLTLGATGAEHLLADGTNLKFKNASTVLLTVDGTDGVSIAMPTGGVATATGAYRFTGGGANGEGVGLTAYSDSGATFTAQTLTAMTSLTTTYMIVKAAHSSGGIAEMRATAVRSGSNTHTTLTLESTPALLGNDYVLLQPTGGFVGIGTTTPNAKLDVQSPSTNATQIILDGSQATGANNAKLSFYLANATPARVAFGHIQMLSHTRTAGSEKGQMRFFVANSGDGDGNETMTLLGSRVGLKCTDPDNDLEVGGTGAGCNTGTYSYVNAGDSAFTPSSSRALKTNIVPFVAPDILARMRSVQPSTYDWRDGSGTNKLGLIAEDFFTVLRRGDGKHISGQDVMMATWLGVQALDTVTLQQAREIAELKARIIALENRR